MLVVQILDRKVRCISVSMAVRGYFSVLCIEECLGPTPALRAYSGGSGERSEARAGRESGGRPGLGEAGDTPGLLH